MPMVLTMRCMKVSAAHLKRGDRGRCNVHGGTHGLCIRPAARQRLRLGPRRLQGLEGLPQQAQQLLDLRHLRGSRMDCAEKL